MTPERRVLDVSHLPTMPFGRQSLPFWGTLGFIIVEGFTLVLMLASYFYLRLGEAEWPPTPTKDPEYILPAVHTLLMLVVLYPMKKAGAAAHAFDRRAVTKWLTISSAITFVTLALRGWELHGLDSRYDTHAYGSVTWGILVLHGTLLVTDLLETIVLAVMFGVGKAERKHYPDVSDAEIYQYFLSLSWLPIYVIVYWGPRFLN